jgi:hypothetical protein
MLERSGGAGAGAGLRGAAAVALVACTCALSIASTAGAVGVPILAGPWIPGQKGYGHAKPSTIFNGGDPTGLVSHIHWESWGGAQAVGTGIAEYVAPSQSVAGGSQEIARIVLFHLGSCHRKRAYDAIEWYFPQHGEHFRPHHYIDSCSGNYVE